MVKNTNEIEKHYFAFISYCHDDERTARRLARELEHYHIPDFLQAQDGIPSSLCPIFRDNDELSAGNLPKQISEALKQSKNLIVICSPRSSKSTWVDKEIKEFIEVNNGSSENIFPFIIEGEPFSKQDNRECYPPSLRGIRYDEERLGVHLKEDKRKQAAFIRLISGMLSVRFDTLWQRHEKELRIKAIKHHVFVSILATLIIFATCLQIRSVRNHLASQSKQAADLANYLTETDDYVTAKRVAMAALPKTLSFPIDRPYIPEAARALWRAWEEESYEKSYRKCEHMPINIIHTPDDVSALAIAPNGRYVVTAEGSTLHIWDSHTGAQSGEPLEKHFRSINAVAFSHNGEKLITGGWDDEIIMWDFQKRKPIMECRPKNLQSQKVPLQYDSLTTIGIYATEMIGSMEGVTGLAFSPDDNYFASLSRDGLFRIWDANTGQELAKSPELQKHNYDYYKCITFNDAATMIVTGDYDGHIRIWNWDHSNDSLRCIKVLSGHSRYVSAIALNKSGTRLASTSYDYDSNSRAIIWDVMSGRMVCQPSFNGDYITSLKNVWFSSDEKSVAFYDGFRVFLVNSETGELVQRLIDANHPGAISVSSDRNMIAASYQFDNYHIYPSIYDKRHIAVWNLEDSLHTFKRRLAPHREQVRSLAFNNDGTLLASGFDDKSIIVWDVETGIPIHEPLLGHSGRITQLSFNPRGNLLSSYSSDKAVIIWDLDNLSSYPPIFTESEVCLSFINDNDLVFHRKDLNVPLSFYVDSKGNVHGCRMVDYSLYDVEADSLFTKTAHYPQAVDYISDNLKLAAHKYGKDIFIYSPHSEEPIACLKKAFEQSGGEVLFSDKGNKAICASSFSISVWDIKKMREDLYIPIEKYGCISISYNERLLAVSRDNQVQIWDINTGTQLYSIKSPSHVYSMAFNRNGDKIAIGSGDDIYLWDLSLQKLLDITRRIYYPLNHSQQKTISPQMK